MTPGRIARPAALQSLLEPHNPLALAVEQTLTRGHEWSRTAAPIAERIAVRLASAIVRDRLRPGERLLEKDISTALRVSRAPTREALRILEREHLVEFRPRRGGVVADLSDADLDEIFSVRRSLNGLLFAEVVEHRRDELERLLAGHMPGLEGAAHGPAEDYVVRSYLLNLAVFDLCGNRLVADLLTSIALRTLRLVRLGHMSSPMSLARSLRSWRAIHRSVLLGDAALVLQAVHERTDDTRRSAASALRLRPALAA